MKNTIQKDLTALLKQYNITFNTNYKRNCVVDTKTMTYELRVIAQGMPVLLMGEIFSPKYGSPTVQIYCDNDSLFDYQNIEFQSALNNIVEYLHILYSTGFQRI